MHFNSINMHCICWFLNVAHWRSGYMSAGLSTERLRFKSHKIQGYCYICAPKLLCCNEFTHRTLSVEDDVGGAWPLAFNALDPRTMTSLAQYFLPVAACQSSHVVTHSAVYLDA